jgi:hypothetical protein
MIMKKRRQDLNRSVEVKVEGCINSDTFDFSSIFLTSMLDVGFSYCGSWKICRCEFPLPQISIFNCSYSHAVIEYSEYLILKSYLIFSWCSRPRAYRRTDAF